MTTSSNGADWLGLRDKVCVITGAAGGLGRQIAASFAEVGARLCLLDRDGPAAQALAGELAARGASAQGFACDIADPASMRAVAEACAAQVGPCAALVNNAAVLHAGGLADFPIDKWNQLLAVNLTGFLVTAQAFRQQMVDAGGGSIVHLSSLAGHFPQGYSGAYSVSKAGVMMLSLQLALEWGEFGIRSNVVSPAMVRTPMSEPFYQDAELLRRRIEMVPARRIGVPADIAEAIVFLSSARATYINGQEILVDGGVAQVLMSQIPRPGYERADHAKAS
ncbi:SDR family NAD(P)-dependent oxidoreductase [Zavarzinia sp. CC-PAN008]|uniref:SDR family NAD(P)-dependent oxidoreductase n=1 Tax=Zavarzinia sp. CC-PAN008 TaxID=3243332 RepID=UPI003F74A743